MSQEFHEELLAKKLEVEKLLKSLPTSSSSSATKSGRRTPTRTTPGRQPGHRNSPTAASQATVAANAAVLQRKWTTVSRMSSERNKKLLDMHNRLLEVFCCVMLKRFYSAQSYTIRLTVHYNSHSVQHIDI